MQRGTKIYDSEIKSVGISFWTSNQSSRLGFPNLVREGTKAVALAYNYGGFVVRAEAINDVDKSRFQNDQQYRESIVGQAKARFSFVD